MSNTIWIDNSQVIGEGAYGAVFRISHRRIVKVFHSEDYTPDQIKDLISDEIEGSKQHRFSLPVLKIVDVAICDGELEIERAKGLLKRYIPYETSDSDIDWMQHQFEKENKNIPWDLCNKNTRKDTQGRLYLVDTQLDPPA